MFTAAMSLIRDDHRYLDARARLLLACTAACNELATVPLQRHAATIVHARDVRADLRPLGLALGLRRQ